MQVTVVSHAGIANRIKNILSALSQHDDVTTLHDTISYIFPSLQLVDTVKNVYPEDWRLHVSEEEQQYTGDLKTIDLLYEKTPQYFVDKYLNVLSRLKINPDIIDFVDNFTSEWDNMVGLHIRSWYCERRKFHSNELFESHIDNLSEDQKFFFCSDNADVQKHFVEKYGDRIITYDREIFNNPKLAESGHHDNIQITTDAFIELLLLSKCDRIIGTYASSFDEVAWWMSGCKSQVTIPKPNNFDEQLNNLIYVKK
tara:strand:+ start:258 stop:1022 length:765 start_codon:yes stop_codon:yes gene_type:complete